MAFRRYFRALARPNTVRHGHHDGIRLRVERLEDRTVPAVSILNNGSSGYAALSFNQSGGYVPPDTCGAAGPSAFVETVNQAVALYADKATGAGALTDSLSHFLFTTGGLLRADGGSGLSDPIVAYDEKIQRFVIGDQDVNFNTHVSAFDLAVSKTSNPTTLTSADWTFYKITTTQAGEDADYPGNFGYNADAFVFTLNMFAVSGTSGTNHTQVVSVSAADLAAGVAPHVYANNLADFSVRPTTMHDAVAGDPMWLVTDHGDGLSIDVYKMSSVLTASAAFAKTNLAVTPYSGAVAPKNPSGTSITTNIDSRIMKAAEANNTIVAAHTVAPSGSTTQDVAQWYAIDVSSSTPVLAQQGRVSAGSNTYVFYPGIDINSAGAIGMSFMQSGTDTTTDYMSMWVTGRVSTDAAGSMEVAVKVPAGTGLANYTDFANPHRAGDLSTVCGSGYFAMFTLTAASMGFAIYAPAILQQLRGFSPLWAGYAIGAESLTWTIAGLAVAGATGLWDARWIRFGALLLVASCIILALTMADGALAWVLIGGGLMGAAFGFSWAFMSRRVLGALSDEDRAIGSSAITAVRQSGDADALGAFQRWQDPAWKRNTLSLR